MLNSRVCIECDGKGWVLEANPYNCGDVNWEECYTCDGKGKTYLRTEKGDLK